MKIKLDCE